MYLLNNFYIHKFTIQQELENENRELRMSLDKYKVLFNRQDSTTCKYHSNIHKIETPLELFVIPYPLFPKKYFECYHSI